MPRVTEMLAVNDWTDADFNFDPDYDFFHEQKHIRRSDGRTLYHVSCLMSGAWYSVHFCVDACEIWAVDLRKLRLAIEYEPYFVRYSPSKKKAGLPSARGYCLPCAFVAEFGHRWDMPGKLVDRFSKAKTKDEGGQLAEQAFLWLVNDRRFFPAIFVGKATKASPSDDYAAGLDFWINGEIPVQVKLDGPGGVRGTGNLFFQTHTLPLRECRDWYGYTRL